MWYILPKQVQPIIRCGRKKGAWGGRKVAVMEKNVEEHRMGKFVGVMVAVVEGV